MPWQAGLADHHDQPTPAVPRGLVEQPLQVLQFRRPTISIRDSSGWDTRYLTRSRLYGEVGFSGRVVGVQVNS
jgi:hypothetical protein